MDKRNLFIDYCKTVENLGYRVFICVDSSYNYAYIVNEKDEIGYMQLGDFFGGVTFSTSHKPCKECGTGFGLNDSLNSVLEITKKKVEECFMVAPDWATRSQLSAVRKWTFTERMEKDQHFRNNVVELKFEIMDTIKLIASIEEAGIITSGQLYALVRRANSRDKDAFNVCFKEFTVFADEALKHSELNKLRNEAKKRSTVFGFREKNVLEGDNIRLALCCFRGSTPVYWVLSDNGSFEYYIAKEINVVG